jgi:hypothetical protein
MDRELNEQEENSSLVATLAKCRALTNLAFAGATSLAATLPHCALQQFRHFEQNDRHWDVARSTKEPLDAEHRAQLRGV